LGEITKKSTESFTPCGYLRYFCGIKYLVKVIIYSKTKKGGKNESNTKRNNPTSGPEISGTALH
jgi:hypothetical protein